MMKTWIRGMAAAGFGLVAAVGSTMAQPAQPAGANAGQPGHEDRVVDGDLPGPVDSLKDLQDTGKMVFKLADTNNDNQISQKEATDAGNLLVGGFFFRADQNGDGTLTADEAKQAREALLRQKPFLRVVMQRAANAEIAPGQPVAPNAQPGGSNPAQGIANLLDGNNDRQLQASELRQAVQTTVQGLFAAADTNRDNQMSPAELNAAVIGAAQSAAQAAFQAADADRNNALSQDEFNKAILTPAGILFSIVDADGDNQITAQEAQAAQRVAMSRLQMFDVPEPGNSPRNLIESEGRSQRSPIPNFGTPNAPSRTQPAPGAAAPAQPR